MAGRPSKYSMRVAAYICSQISQGRSLVSICKEDKMPSTTTVFMWLADERYKQFQDNYARATTERTEYRVEEMFDIADDGHNDWMERNYRDQEEWVTNGEALQRSKLRVDTRKWYAARMLPKKYGDRIDVTSDGEKLPTPITTLPVKELKQ